MRAQIYKIQGNPTEVANRLDISLTNEEMQHQPESNLEMINCDLPRSQFIDPQIDYEVFCTRWRAAVKQNGYSYIQGDMIGSTIASVYYDKLVVIPLSAGSTKKLSFTQDFFLVVQDKKTFKFGYTNDNNEMCGFSLVFSKQKPHQWIINILQNATALHDYRLCTTYIQNFSVNDQNTMTSDIHDLLQTLGSDLVADFISHFFLKNDAINVDVVEWCDQKSILGTVQKPTHLLNELLPEITQERNKMAAKEELEPHAQIMLYFEIVMKATSEFVDQISSPQTELNDTQRDPEPDSQNEPNCSMQ